MPLGSSDARGIAAAFVLLHLDAGGLERIFLNILRHLDPADFRCGLVLIQKPGEFFDQVPAHVHTDVLGCRSRNAVLPLRRSLARMRPDVVVSGTVPANVATVIAARWLRNRPALLVNEHTPPGQLLARVPRPGLYRSLMRWAYRHADGIGVPAEEVGDDLRATLRLPDLDTIHLPNPVYDDSLEELAEAEPVGGAPCEIVAAGRLTKAKGFDVLLRALPQVRASIPPRLCILGEGPERGSLERLAQDLGLAGRVFLPGVVANPYAFFRRARVVVVASRQEATPNVLVEAMACGTPVVATEASSSVRVLLEDGASGRLVPRDDPAALAEAVSALLHDEQERARLTARGRDRARQFHVAAAAPAYVRVLRSLTGGHPPDGKA